MAFSGSPTITSDGIAAIIDEIQNDAFEFFVRITYTDSGSNVLVSDSSNLLSNFNFTDTQMSIGAADLNLEFEMNAGDEVTNVELVYNDGAGDNVDDYVLDEYAETGAVFTYGGKYVITGWTVTLQAG